MKFLFVTGSRSEWGYIKPILDILKKKNLKPIFVLQICIYLKVMDIHLMR